MKTNLKNSIRYLAIASAIFVSITNGSTYSHAADTALKDLKRSKNVFSYYQLGHHVPRKSGHPSYKRPRLVVHDGIVLPMKVSPKNGEHMYCNSQVYGFGGSKGPSGNGGNDKRNYAYPWMPNICELRGNKSNAGVCLKKSIHQGQDCRPPKPQKKHYKAVAVEDGRITSIGGGKSNTVRFTGDSQIIWKYLHMRNRVPKATKKAGDTLGTVSNYFKTSNCGGQYSDACTTIHLHLEAWTVANGKYGPVDVLPSLIVANQKALGNSYKVDDNQDLQFDSRFEIKAGSTSVGNPTDIKTDCDGALNNPSIGTELAHQFSSLWCHNGSVMGLVEAGEQRRFVYFKPRTGLAEYVKSEPVLFSGSTDNKTYEGLARHYSSRCGSQLFDARGHISADFKNVSISGRRKVFNGPTDCSFSFATVALQFSYISSYNNGSNDPIDNIATDQPDSVHESCKNTVLSPMPKGLENKSFSNFWYHNCSIVGLVAGANDSRKFYYVRPKSSLQAAVSRQPLLFDGAKQSRQYFGETIQFSSTCGDRYYNVGGPIEEDGLGVVMTGERPVLKKEDGACILKQSKNTCLRFSFAGKTLSNVLSQPLKRIACDIENSDGGNPADDRVAIVDTAVNAAPYISKLHNSGVEVIGRYYSRKYQPYLPEKRIAFNKINGKNESSMLLEAGFSILSVYQYRNNIRRKFVDGLSDTGSTIKEARADANAALQQANMVGQPEGTAIYFGVDFNLKPNDVEAVTAVKLYFRELTNVIGGRYKLGVYGNGVSNRILRDAGLVDYSWISASVGHYETDDFYNSQNWHLFQNQVDRRWYQSANKCPSGISLDTNIQNTSHSEFGFWGNGRISPSRKVRIFKSRAFANINKVIRKNSNSSSGAISKKRCRLQAGQGWVWLKDNSVKRVRNGRYVDDISNWRKIDIDDDGQFDGYAQSNGFSTDMKTMPKF